MRPAKMAQGAAACQHVVRGREHPIDGAEARLRGALTPRLTQDAPSPVERQPVDADDVAAGFGEVGMASRRRRSGSRNPMSRRQHGRVGTRTRDSRSAERSGLRIEKICDARPDSGSAGESAIDDA
jgi:hypothetical protein